MNEKQPKRYNRFCHSHRKRGPGNSLFLTTGPMYVCDFFFVTRFFPLEIVLALWPATKRWFETFEVKVKKKGGDGLVL